MKNDNIYLLSGKERGSRVQHDADESSVHLKGSSDTEWLISNTAIS